MIQPLDIQVRDNQSTPASLGSMRKYGAFGLRFSTILPGGCGECTFKLPATEDFLNPPAQFGYNYRVDIQQGGAYVWSGRMEDLEMHKGSDGVYWQIRALGFGVNLNDQYYTTQTVNNTETSTIVSNAITNLANPATGGQIAATTITATGFTISNVTAVTLKMVSAAAAVAWAARYGLVTTYNPQQWYVYPDDDGTIRFTFESRPTTVSIRGLLADFEEADFALFGKNLYNRAVVQYNGAGSVATVDNSALQAVGPGGWGVIKTFAAVLPEITQSADATQAANALITQFGTPRLAATSLTTYRNVEQLDLRDSNNNRVDPIRIRAGTLMQLLDMPNTDGAYQGIQWANTFVIAGTEYDEDTQTLTITPEGYDNSSQKLMAKVEYLLRGRLGLTGVA